MRFPIIALLLCLVLSFQATAALTYANNLRLMIDRMADIKEEYNSNIAKVPGWAKAMLGSEKINATIILDDNTLVNIGIIFEQGMIAEMRQGRLKEPSINLYVTEQDIDDIMALEGYRSRLEKVRELYENNLIKYEYTSLRARLKFSTVGFAFRLFGG